MLKQFNLEMVIKYINIYSQMIQYDIYSSVQKTFEQIQTLITFLSMGIKVKCGNR